MSGKLKDLEKRLKLEPDNLGLKVTVAGLMREAGRSLDAVEIYRSVALAYRDQGRKQQAIAVCRSILEIAPDDVRCNALLSQLTAPEGTTPAAPTPHSSVPSLSRTPTGQPRPVTPPPPAAPSRPSSSSLPPRSSSPTGSPLRSSSTPSSPGRIPSASPARTPSSPPARTPSSPPSRTPTLPARKVTIPPRAPSQSGDGGTPPPMSSRMPSEAPPPPAAAARLPLEPPARRSSGKTGSPDGPQRRSSMEETPLPRPVPHHIYDRTSKATLPDLEELDTNPDAQRPRTASSNGLAEAARKITGLINRDDDVAQPMDTRPVRRIRDEDLKKLAHPPPTGEHARLSEEDIITKPQEALTKPGGHEDDELTVPRDLVDSDDD